MMFSTVSAVRISRTSRFFPSGYLCHFALQTVFPFSLVGRLHGLFHYAAFTPTTNIGTPSPWDSRPLGNPVFRHRGTLLERLRLPTHALE